MEGLGAQPGRGQQTLLAPNTDSSLCTGKPPVFTHFHGMWGNGTGTKDRGCVSRNILLMQLVSSPHRNNSAEPQNQAMNEQHIGFFSVRILTACIFLSFSGRPFPLLFLTSTSFFPQVVQTSCALQRHFCEYSLSDEPPVCIKCCFLKAFIGSRERNNSFVYKSVRNHYSNWSNVGFFSYFGVQNLELCLCSDFRLFSDRAAWVTL